MGDGTSDYRMAGLVLPLHHAHSFPITELKQIITCGTDTLSPVVPKTTSLAYNVKIINTLLFLLENMRSFCIAHMKNALNLSENLDPYTFP